MVEIWTSTPLKDYFIFGTQCWITISVFGFILIQSLILGFWFMTYTTLNQERIKVSELEGPLAKMANYEALLKYNEDADKKLYEVKAKTEG